MKRWLWLGGWAFPTTEHQALATQRWPDTEHVILYPGKLCMTKLQQAIADFRPERLLGYSLGTLLLLKYRNTLPAIPMTLFAPILGFPKEFQRGGKVSERRLVILKRWLRRSPMEALKDFANQAGMKPRPHLDTIPYALDDLLWGIEQIETLTAEPPSPEENVTAFLGKEDPLLDVSVTQDFWPSVRAIPGVGHEIEDLFRSGAW